MWKMCVRIGMRYLCAIHIIDAYSSTSKENASNPMNLINITLKACSK